jgi:uncharacterized 2Fe-2S/4Fe-4S cluster protein (DUF4445 family)
MKISCQAMDGKSILEVAIDRDIPFRTDCGGQGQCGQCLVNVNPAEHVTPLTENEKEILSPELIQTGFRLACETRIKGSLAVAISDSALDSGDVAGKALDDETLIIGSIAKRRDLIDRKSRPLGIALDIGTTTLAAYLCDLESGSVLTTTTATNPQRRFGEDVVSRISYADKRESSLSDLRVLLTDKINRLISLGAAKSQAPIRDIQEVTVVGNTTMQHIFMGFHPRGLGVAPYLPVSCDAQNLNAEDVGLNLLPNTPVHVFPVISGFVGGDTLGVILSEKPHESEKITLIVDIGTNGELVLGNKAGLWVTSCATGPALEGAHIKSGMRATDGAIYKVSIDPASYETDYAVLGDDKQTPPLGICGSGIVDAVAEMLTAGLILPSGRFQEGQPGIITDQKGIGRKFILVPSRSTAGTPEISITLADVRQIQLAKAALSVGVKLLMRRAAISRFDRLVLTGAFGARFNWRNAVRIGMLPESSKHAEVKIVENAAGRGAVMALLDGRLRKQISVLAAQVTTLNLSEDPEFTTEFTTATLFPDPLIDQ